MKNHFFLKTNLTFWTIVVGALSFATAYQAIALNRDISYIPESFRIKIPSIILIGSLAQVFLLRFLGNIKRVIGEYNSQDLTSNELRTRALTVQKNIGKIRTVFILVNSLGFFLGPAGTLIIYHFSGRTYPVGEMFYIISAHVLIGTAASLLQMAMVRVIFFDILSSFKIHENLSELKGIKLNHKRLLAFAGLSFLILFLISGQLYGYYAHISTGLLKPEDLTPDLLIQSFIQGVLYVCLIILVYSLLNREEEGKLKQLQESLSANIHSKDRGFSKISIISFDEYGELAGSINAYTSRLENLVENVAEAGKTVTETTGELELSVRESESALSRMREISAGIVDDIYKENEAMAVATTSQEKISRSISSVGSSAAKQSIIVNDSSAAITEISANIRSVAQLSEKASEVTRSLSVMTINGSGKLRETMKSIVNLKEASGRVNSIVEAIQNISDQTNLLAMNAAIEAAHAGKAGAGFSVVAGEVRKLAEESLKSAREIGVIISEMTLAIAEGVNSAEETEKAFTQITDSVSSTSRIIDEVSASMEEQQNAAEDVSTAMSNLVEVSTLLKNESEEQELFNREMKESFTSLLTSIENLSDRSRILKEMDEILTDKINGLSSVSEINGRAVQSLQEAVNR